jgi:hypothetical protein
VAETTERNATVRDAVRGLPEHERSVVELFYLAGLSQQEVAQTLAVPLTTVKKRLQYARERLKSSGGLDRQIISQLTPGGFDQWQGAALPGAWLADHEEDPDIAPLWLGHTEILAIG